MRHLVSVAGGDTDLLDRALVAAAVAGEPTLVLDPPPAELWLAFGVPPRPVLLLDVAVRVDRPTATAPLVRQPLRVTSAPLRSLYGQVVGPGDLPLSGVRVEVTTTGAATYTDAAGRFSFASIPSDLPARLRLHGRNRHLTAEVATGSTGAVVIHCDLEES
jgi:hypothetical protein